MRAKSGLIVALLKETLAAWMNDKASRLAAALSYYAVFSIAPLLLITIALLGLVFGEEAARGQIVGQIGGLIGLEVAQAIEGVIENARQPRQGMVATLIGVATLLLGASGAYGQLQEAMNTIWKVGVRPGRGWMGAARARLLSFAMVLGAGFLLLAALVASAGLAAISHSFENLLPLPEWLLHSFNFCLSFLIIALVFALIFKIVPEAPVAWVDVWIGAALTSLLFTAGNLLIGFYLGWTTAASPYGVAGSLVVVLIWVYYSAQVLFLGAEFTHVYAGIFGSRCTRDQSAVPIILATAACGAAWKRPLRDNEGLKR